MNSDGDDPRDHPATMKGPGDPTRVEYRRRLIARARCWTDDERRVIADVFYDELLAQHPSLRPKFESVDMAAQARKLSATLGLVASLDDDRQRLGSEALRLGAIAGHGALDATDFQTFATTLAHVLALFQTEIPYQLARQLWQSDLDAIVEVMQAIQPDAEAAD